MTSAGVTLNWPVALAQLQQVWDGISGGDQPTSTDLMAWRDELARLEGDMRELKHRGAWSRGPVDLLSICRIHRRELVHTAALAWLCDPEATHGLGHRFLSGLLALTGDVPDLNGAITATTEVSRELSRADVVVTDGAWTLVVEAKIGADEGPSQCERLFRDWMNESDVRFVFLTVSRRAPREVTTEEARLSWTAASWSDVLEVLRKAAEGTPPAGPGATAVGEYQRTLVRLSGNGTR